MGPAMPSESLLQMRTSRRILRDELPRIERGLRDCATVEKKREFLSRMRGEASEEGGVRQGAWLAFCYAEPRSAFAGDEDGNESEGLDPDELRRKEDHEYIGRYVKPKRYGPDSARDFERDDEGNQILVQSAQRALFGAPWAKTWQASARPRDAASPDQGEKEDLLRALGPKDEVGVVGVPPPKGVSGWEELRELQGRVKKECEREKVRERKRREREERIELVRGWLRRFRAKLSVVKRMEVAVDQAGGKKVHGACKVEMAEKVDSGYPSRDVSMAK